MSINTHEVSCALRSTTDKGQFFRRNLRRLLAKLLDTEDKPWKEFFSKTVSGTEKRHGPYDTFSAYLTDWSQFTVKDLQDVFHDDAEVIDWLDRVEQRPAHIKVGDVDNVHIRPTGTSKESGLRRLRKDRDDLHQRRL